jgi:ClpP class serine protease
MAKRKPASRALKIARGTVWAMGPEHVRTVLDIAARVAGVAEEGIEAIEARIGRPLNNTRHVMTRNGVAVVPVHGPLFRRADMFSEISGATAVDTLATDIQAADDDPAVNRILLDIDSPGGEAAGIIELAEHIRGVSAVTPVTAYIGHLGASGAYALAAGAAEVVMAKMAVAGQVGVVLTVRAVDDSDDVEFVSAQSPDKRLPVSSDEGREKLQALTDRLGEEFVGAVAQLRGLDTADVIAWRGGVLVGHDAVEAGMADRIGTFEGTLSDLQGDAMSGKTSPAQPAITRAFLDAEHPELVAAIQDEAIDGLAEKMDDKFSADLERETARVRAVLQVIDPHGEERWGELAAMAWDGTSTAESAAVKVLASERAKHAAALAGLRADIPAPIAASTVDSTGRSRTMPKPAETPEAQAEQAWNADTDGVRAEFGTKAAYLAWMRASADGRVKSFGRARNSTGASQ